ncbi:retrovirus-related pol polyprotein from transposon TNT 1-94 [Tanacetum coccineum]
MQMVGGNGGNQFRQYARQNVGNQNGYNAVRNVGNQNLNGNGNFVVARVESNVNGNNGNQIRCYNCKGLGHLARNCTVRLRRRDAAYLQTRLLIAQKEEAGIQLQAEEFDLMATAIDLDEIEEVNANCILMSNLQQISTLGTQTNKAPVYDSDGSAENDSNGISEVPSMEQGGGTVDQHPATVEETHAYFESLYNNLAIEESQHGQSQLSKEKSIVSSLLEEKKKLKSDFKIREDELLDKQIQLENKIKELDNILVKTVVSQDIMSIVQSNSVVDTSNLQTELERMKEPFENCIIKKENEYAKLWNDWYKKCEECKYDKISYDKAYNDMKQKIERFQAQLGDQKGKSKDTLCVSNTLDPLSQKLENENVELEFQVLNYAKENAHLKTTYKNLFLNVKFVVRQPNAFQSERQNFSKLRVPQKVDETNDLSNPVTSNSVPTPQESKVVKIDNVISLGMFRINPSKTFREDKFVPINKVRASVKTKPITVSQPHVITKNHVNSDLHSLSFTGVDNTTKTIRPQPRSNTKNDRVPSVSNSSCIKNKEFEVEEHHRNLLISKNKKPMSSECNNIKLVIRNDKSEVVCAICKQCLITANHNVCVLNYVNGMNSRGKKQKANASNVANQKKRKPTIRKTNKEPTSKRFPNSTFSLAGHSNLFMVRRLRMLKAHDRNSEASHKFHLEVLGNRHNLFSVGQFCDSDLEVAFKRNTYFVRNLEGVDLIKGNRTTNLYTINLHEMASASPICLMARATSTKTKDEAPEVIKTFLKKITVLLQALVIMNDREDIKKLGAKGDIGFSIGYSANSCAYRVYNRRTKKIIETINVTFDELSAMAFEQRSSKPGLQSMTSRQITMHDDYIGGQPSAATRTAPAAQAPQVLQTLTTSTTTSDTTPTPTNSSSQATNIPYTSQDVDELEPQQQHVPQQENQAPL